MCLGTFMISLTLYASANIHVAIHITCDDNTFMRLGTLYAGSYIHHF